MPRQSSPWSKELDLRFARAVKDELGDVVRHLDTSEGEKTVFPWHSILTRLTSSNTWPEAMSSVEYLKKRWETFRVWYAKGRLCTNKSRASVIRLSKLIDYLRNRDYEVESKPGRKKSITPMKKRKENEDDEEKDENESSGEEEEEEKKEVESPIHHAHQSTPPKKRSKMELAHITQKPLPLDPRLESWLEFLTHPRLGKAFRIHTHSEVVIEPHLLLNCIVSGKSVENTSVITFAQAIAPTGEWAKRVVDVTDSKMIRSYLDEKVSFFLFSPITILIGGQKLLFSFVFFPPHVAEKDSQVFPYLWTVFQDTNDSGVVPDDKSHRLEIFKSIGLPQEGNGGIHFRNEVIRSTSSSLLLALARFQDCLNKLISSQSPRVMDIWPGEERVKNELLSAILLSPHANIRAAPFIEPPSLPFKSIIEAIKSLLGVNLPAWCNSFPLDHRDSLLSAIHDLTKTVVLIANLKGDYQSLSWHRNSEDKEVLLLVEEDNHFGGILRLTKLTATHATLSILVKTSSIRNLFINHRPSSLDEHVEHQLELQPSLEISVTLAHDVKISLRIC